jgi:caffeoyl-CoA O-methyltransferase
MEIVNKQIADYTESFTTDEPDVIKELVRASDEDLEYIDMLTGRQVGRLLRMLTAISGARRILEVGTFTGYSAIMMAGALPDDGELITLEMNEHYRRISKPFFEREPYCHIIRQIMGNALEIIPGLEGSFDLIFLDADKVNYPSYYAMVKSKVNPGGLIVVDNTLWDGAVIDPADPKTQAIHRMNEMIHHDPDTEQVMLPVRDGLTVVRVI